ncbi:hypothetical protein M8A51_23090 [Schlegelella sp. S2-27]|uniref:Uncharacterized protein n=1 Tax=Caldimonas mangrovi TaxID=2944811 RepID=A0ABT0YVJ0_9BURK|nr:hypothetical protein [Caldimonas mangrovi]MCM5682424.1 hypothetical protein [Caldimonas mangrovi]
MLEEVISMAEKDPYKDPKYRKAQDKAYETGNPDDHREAMKRLYDAGGPKLYADPVADGGGSGAGGIDLLMTMCLVGVASAIAGAVVSVARGRLRSRR